MRKIPLFLVLIFLFLSCVPTKDLIYLSGTPKENKEIHKINTNPYKLQVGDNISIDVTSDNVNLVAVFLKSSGSLSENTSSPVIYSIDVNGNIRMPILGEINVLGYTTKEVRVKIEEKFANYFMKEDSYFVSVKLDGIKYTIMGEINSPGPKVVYQNQLSILDAITFSGDIPISGDKKNVEVIRISPNGNKKVTIDLTSINALNSEIFFIQNNDYINIKALRQKSLTEGLKPITGIVSLISLLTTTILILRGL
ncbi:MAG: polysaccharide biosynthesis/export family protein [Flavobacteriales bacterium]|jgi:polysaccharide export outer membrane protein|tara:strand:- start:1260 stop:2018 length:759 start_codon:yes stop_codon:yes gene_type:complete